MKTIKKKKAHLYPPSFTVCTSVPRLSMRPAPRDRWRRGSGCGSDWGCGGGSGAAITITINSNRLRGALNRGHVGRGIGPRDPGTRLVLGPPRWRLPAPVLGRTKQYVSSLWVSPFLFLFFYLLLFSPPLFLLTSINTSRSEVQAPLVPFPVDQIKPLGTRCKPRERLSGTRPGIERVAV